ncbi:MAG: hypothetical protein HKN82_15690 [Akkermansiaceae bacterium]|nr:hypothetical protein [Akkermansiaceae bacterium]NNM29381.1 hypothetical protein [Akkermansiaceae bacterium]
MFLLAILAFEFGMRKGAEKAGRTGPREALSGGELIDLLYAQDLDQRDFPFPAVVSASTGRTVVPARPADAGTEAITAAIDAAANEVLVMFNGPDSPLRDLRRINEASRFFEDALRVLLDGREGLTCGIPTTAGGGEQRAGYPDLRIEHEASGTVAYLDPKLFEATSVDSGLRTFYYTPKAESSKVTADAHHFLLGFAHDGRDGAWTFTGWKLVDLARLQVRLKAEFQAANRDLYRAGAVLRGSR